MHVSLSVLVSQEVLQMIPKFCFPFDVERYNSSLLACVFFPLAPHFHLLHMHSLGSSELKKKKGNEIRRIFVHCSGKIRHNHSLMQSTRVSW